MEGDPGIGHWRRVLTLASVTQIPDLLPARSVPHVAWMPRDRAVAPQAQAAAWLAREATFDAAAIAFERDAHGRPNLQPPLQAWDCNWSHSGDGLLVAAGLHLRVGVDLEWLRPRPRALQLAERFFAPPEFDWVRAAPDDAGEPRFLRLWCAKEAVLKAHGRGLAFGLDRLQFVEREGALMLHACDAELGEPAAWQLRELAPAPGYVGALAWCARDA